MRGCGRPGASFHGEGPHPGHFTDAVLVFLVLPFPFRFAHLLNDYLLGSLSGYATEINWWQGFGNEVANAGIRIATQGLLQRNFRGRVLH